MVAVVSNAQTIPSIPAASPDQGQASSNPEALPTDSTARADSGDGGSNTTPDAGGVAPPDTAVAFDARMLLASQTADAENPGTYKGGADAQQAWTDASDASPAGQLSAEEKAERLAEIEANSQRFGISKPVLPPGAMNVAVLPVGATATDGAAAAKPAASSISDLFVNRPPEGSLDDAALKRLDGWLPDAIQNGGGNYVKDKQKSEDIVALAKSMGYEGNQVWERDGRDSEKRVTQFSATGAANFLKNVARQDAVFDTAAERPSAFDIYDSAMTDRRAQQLSGMDNEQRKDTFLRNLKGGTDLLERKADFEKSDFQKLDSWLSDALAGQGDMPDDAESQALLVKFAERLGWSNMPERTGADRGSVQYVMYERARREARDMPVADKAADALDYLKQERFLQKSLVAGSDSGDERASIIFEDGFVGKVVQHGVNQGVVTDAVAIDAAMTADGLMRAAPGAGASDGVVDLDPGMFAQAVAQRLSPDAVDPRRLMAGFNYLQRAENQDQQQQRLTETILAFQTKDQAGIGAMSRATWTEGLADYSDKLADIIGRRIEDPTSKRIANVLDHVGVPGYEKIKLSKGTKLHLANDETGQVADIQVEKKQNGFARFAMDAVMTGLSFTPAAPAAAGYFAMRSVEAAVKGDGMGAITAGLGAVGGFASSFAAAGNGAGAAAKIAQGARITSGAIGVQQGLKNDDLLGALTSGLGSFAAGAQMNGANGLAQSAANLGRAASGLDAALNKDYLGAASSFSAAAGSQFAGNNDIASSAGTIDKIATLAGGILNKDASQIVSAFGDQIGAFTKDWPGLNQPAPPQSPFGPNTAFDANGNPIILQSGYADSAAASEPGVRSLQVAPGDTLSQIAARHGTTVDDLMAANPEIADPDRIYAGQSIALPGDVTPIGIGQQQRLSDFDNVKGRGPNSPGAGTITQSGDAGSGNDPAIDTERANLYRSDLRFEQLALRAKRDSLLQELEHVQNTLPRDRHSSSRTASDVRNELAAVDQRFDANQARLVSAEPLTTVELHVKPILDRNAGHAFAIVTDPYGNKVQTRGGPEADNRRPEDGTVFGDIHTQSVTYNQHAKDYNDTQTIWPSITIGSFSGDQAALINQAMQEAAAEVQMEHHQYNIGVPNFQNSNSAIHEILKRTEQKTGLDFDIPDDPPGPITPGWDTDLPN